MSSGPLILATALPYDVPVELGRDDAQRLAERELADPAYHLDDPSLFEQGIRWVLDRLRDLLDLATSVVPGGYWGLLVLLILLGGGTALVVWRAGGVRRSGTTARAMFVGREVSAAQHRRRAEQAAASGRWEEAVRERFRAIVRRLEERTVLDPRPGRTADEAAAEAGRVFPALARELATAASTFDGVVYGSRPATSTDDRFLTELDKTIEATPSRAFAAGARV